METMDNNTKFSKWLSLAPFLLASALIGYGVACIYYKMYYMGVLYH